MFYGRKNELSALSNEVAKPNAKAKVLVMTGRRRVGKSTLVQQFSTQAKGLQFFQLTGIPPKRQNRMKTELNNLASQIAVTFSVPKPILHDWNDAIQAIGVYVKQGNCILLIDEINWFGKTHDDMAGTLFALWEQTLRHITGLTLIMTGSLAGWIHQNFIDNTGWYGRISWHEKLQPLKLKDNLQFIPASKAKRLSNHEKMSFMLVSGGIPFYLEQYDFSQSFDSNIQRLAFSPQGYFFTEFDILMADLFRAKAERVETILRFLNSQKRTIGEIAAHLNQDKANGHLYNHLNMLTDSAFITKTLHWDVNKGVRVEHDGYYYISDPYLRFYLKAIAPQAEAIRKGQGKAPKNLSSLLGLQFEHVMRNNVDIIYRALNLLPESVIHADRYIGKDLEIDFLIETSRSWYIVEMKYYQGEVPQKVSHELKQKIERFGMPKNKSIKTLVLHVNGASKGLEQSEYVDFAENIFDHIH